MSSLKKKYYIICKAEVHEGCLPTSLVESKAKFGCTLSQKTREHLHNKNKEKWLHWVPLPQPLSNREETSQFIIYRYEKIGGSDALYRSVN